MNKVLISMVLVVLYGSFIACNKTDDIVTETTIEFQKLTNNKSIKWKLIKTKLNDKEITINKCDTIEYIFNDDKTFAIGHNCSNTLVVGKWYVDSLNNTISLKNNCTKTAKIYSIKSITSNEMVFESSSLNQTFRKVKEFDFVNIYKVSPDFINHTKYLTNNSQKKWSLMKIDNHDCIITTFPKCIADDDYYFKLTNNELDIDNNGTTYAQNSSFFEPTSCADTIKTIKYIKWCFNQTKDSIFKLNGDVTTLRAKIILLNDTALIYRFIGIDGNFQLEWYKPK